MFNISRHDSFRNLAGSLISGAKVFKTLDMAMVFCRIFSLFGMKP